MILFDLYFLLQESSINSVSPRLLGLSTSMVDLPDTKPYGFWVDKSGNFIKVGIEGHWDVGERIIKVYQHLLKQKGANVKIPADLYRFFLDAGWMRIVISGNVVYYELALESQPTLSQTRFLKFIKDLYEQDMISRH